jgi:hypothetical protein
LCHYQQSLTLGSVLTAPDYSGALARAVLALGVGVPGFVDVAFDFDRRMGGFDGIIVEAKSGSQQYRDTVAQLRTYRGARPRRTGGRYLVWGVVQSPTGSDATADHISRLVAAATPEEDVWIFSGADSVGLVLNTLFPLGRS